MIDAENSSPVADDKMQTIELTKQPIDLYKILKFEGLVASGGEAKAAIAEGFVTLNNVVETQKRKKIVSGDIIGFAGELYRMHCDKEMETTKPESKSGAGADKNTADKTTPKNRKITKPKRKPPTPKKAGRKAIGIKS